MKKNDKPSASDDEASFLAHYSLEKYPRPSVAADIVALTLRSVGRDTDKRASMGNVGGTLFVRASKAAADTYDAMRCRGFEGEYDGGARARLRAADAAWICSFILFLALFLHLEGIV